MYSYDFFPEDVQKEITSHLDEPTKRLSRSVSTRWRNAKEWCNDEYIRDAYTIPIREWEVKDIGFILTYTDNETDDSGEYSDATSAYLRLMMLDGYRLTIVSLELAFEYNINDWVRIEAKTDVIDVSGTAEGIAVMFSRIKEGDLYWVDPFTSKDIVTKRLSDCHVAEVSTWQFFPWHDRDVSELDHNLYEAYQMYVLGYGVITRQLNVDDFSVLYDYRDDDHIIKVLDQVKKGIDEYNAKK